MIHGDVAAVGFPAGLCKRIPPNAGVGSGGDRDEPVLKKELWLGSAPACAQPSSMYSHATKPE